MNLSLSRLTLKVAPSDFPLFRAATTAMTIFSFITFSLLLTEPAIAAEPNLAKGQQIASQICIACHGMDGNSPTPANPKIAGQIPEYLYKQLVDFKPKDKKPAQRNNPVMLGILKDLKEEDMRNLAGYYAAQAPKLGAAKNPQLIKLGEKIYRAGNASSQVPACAACHAPNGAGLPAQFPRLAGQYAEYIEAQLKAFRSGERNNDFAKMMQTIATRMTDTEIKAVADYIAGLR